MPRSAWLSPLLCGLAMSLNPFMSAWRLRSGHLWISVLFALAGLVVGGLFALQGLANQWSLMRRQGDQLLLIPGRGLEWLPGWFMAVFLPRVFHGPVTVPLAGASLEWVGRTLLLHGNPSGDLRLGRGREAEGIVVWLRGQGVGEPVGP